MGPDDGPIMLPGMERSGDLRKAIEGVLVDCQLGSDVKHLGL